VEWYVLLDMFANANCRQLRTFLAEKNQERKHRWCCVGGSADRCLSHGMVWTEGLPRLATQTV